VRVGGERITRAKGVRSDEARLDLRCPAKDPVANSWPQWVLRDDRAKCGHGRTLAPTAAVGGVSRSATRDAQAGRGVFTGDVVNVVTYASLTARGVSTLPRID